MTRLGASLTVLAATVLGACGPAVLPTDLDETASAQQEIVGGTVTSGDPATVAITVGNGSSFEEFCTGTLVGPKTVLTAAHCINAYGGQYTYYIAIGPTASRPTQAVRVVSQTENPNYNGQGYDFGVLQLQTPVTTVTPIPMNDQNIDTSWVGRAIRHVGYGITNPSGAGSGTKREVTYTLRQVRSLTIESGASGKQTCQGDSGGPAFMVPPGGSAEVLVGVVSYGDADCAQYGYDGRVDKALPWIRGLMQTWEQPTCELDGACKPGCTPVDQDCACIADGQCTAACLDASRDPDCPVDCGANGICSQQACPNRDVDCVDPGYGCQLATQCESRLCVSDSQNPNTYCSKPCGSALDCPSGMTCGELQYCIQKQKYERQYLDPCYPSDDYCAGGNVCTGPTDGISRCVKPCNGTADCGGDGACEGGASGTRYCRPANVSFSPIYVSAGSSIQGPAAAGCASVGGLPLGWLALLGLVRRRRRRAQ